MSALDGTAFTANVDGEPVGFYAIKNKKGIEATFTNYGQRLISLYLPDKNGKMNDVVLGFDSLEKYRHAREQYFGAIIGRYANRIAKGKFNIDGQEYKLATNNGENHLHGGTKGFNDVVWTVNHKANNQIEFMRLSPDMEEGYPGNLKLKVRYTLNEYDELKIVYEGSTDKPTHINLTHHSFFNLRGEGNGTVNKHLLMINADHFTPVNEGLIVGKEIKCVEGTPFDFREPKAIGKDLGAENIQLELGGGYDHNFVLNDTPKNRDGLVFAARIEEPESGRVMEVYTNEPGLQFYGGNFLDGSIVGKSGKPYLFRGAFCLETQHFPDSPNQKDFPSTLLRPGMKYKSVCVYKFSVHHS